MTTDFEAWLYEKLDGKKVRCSLCHHRCLIAAGKRGICGVRENRDGTLYSLVYGKAIALHVDPIEKKPLFHFLPGSGSYSLATAGCNFTCLNCQNSDISQMPRERGEIWGQEVSPEKLVAGARNARCASISYTYTEPTVFFEYACDASRRAHQEGIRNVFVTNGFMTEAALRTIGSDLDAANVDLKSFREEFYRRICGARLEPVCENIKTMHRSGVWVEVTTLVIPGHNDSEAELTDIALFLKDVSPDIPWHLSAFYPTYKLTTAGRTPPSTLRNGREIGRKVGLRYVYTGNIPGDEGENTFCYHCGKKVIERFGFSVGAIRLKEGKCAFCGTPIAGVWK